jgi:hypothetical protein
MIYYNFATGEMTFRVDACRPETSERLSHRLTHGGRVHHDYSSYMRRKCDRIVTYIKGQYTADVTMGGRKNKWLGLTRGMKYVDLTEPKAYGQ